MKAFITPAYTFTPGASGAGTVDLSGIASFDIKRLVAIINQTRGALIYSTANANLKYTAVAGSLVTLNFDTSSHVNTDTLQIVYELPGDLADLLEQVRAEIEINTLETNSSLGDITDPAETDYTASASVIGILKGLSQMSDQQILELQQLKAQVGAVQNASYQELTTLTTTAQTITAPALARGCKIQADGDNSANLRIKIGGATATISSGIKLEPGRSEDFSFAGNISVIAESGSNQKVYVQFGE